MSYRFTKASLLTGTIMAGAMFAAPLHAQTATDNTDDATDQGPAFQAEQEASGEPIIVTGSRIARRNVDTAAPVAIVGEEEFSLSGTVNVENVINTLPQVIPGTTSFSNNPGNGTATLNLRGLGANRTLVLVNGRRWMFYDTAQIVDLNTIPSFLIDSVDVVTGGASAVYGSDALAGVVNFRLRNIEGIEMGGQYALTERGDGETYQLHGAIGTAFADGRGSATVFAEYYNRSAIFQGARGFSRFALGGETGGIQQRQFGSSIVPQGALFYSGTGDTTGTDFDATTAVFFDAPGQFRSRTGADTYNYAPDNYLQLPQERYLLGGYADYDIGGGHTFYTEVAYVNNRVQQELAPTPIGVAADINLASVQGFLNPAEFAQLQQLDATETGAAANDGIVRLTVFRRVNESGSRNSLDERNAFRVLGGVTGPIGEYLNYDANYYYARTRNANVQNGNISRSAFLRGLDGTDPALNIFGLGTLTPAMVDQITILAQNGDTSSLEVVNATISGTFGDFALGSAEPIGFAIGTEYRKVGSEFIPDTALSSGDVIGFNAGQATQGEYDVKEAFAELNIPIEFGSARLELNGAARYSDYSIETVGGVFTYAGGVQFSPVRDITFRAQYQRAIRAPNVGELFGGSAIGFPGATDPCATSAAAGAGALRDLCIANGVPAANVGIPLGSPGSPQLNAQIPALFGGNAFLGEETSDSFTAGVVLQPRFIPGLTITADYFDITVEDAITTITLDTAFDLCFNQAQNTSDPFCAPFFANGPIRDAAGQILSDNNPPALGGANVGELGVKGVDLEVNYTTSVPFSLFTDTGEQRVNLSFLGTWTDSSYLIPLDGFATIECAGRFGSQCGNPTPSYKWTSRASFIDGPVTTSIRWRHLSGVADNDDDTDFSQFNGVERIPAYDLFDLSFAFDLMENFTLNMGVNNIFDTLPQTPTFNGLTVSNTNNGTLLGDNQEQANTYPSTYDVLGRRYFVSGTFKF